MNSKQAIQFLLSQPYKFGRMLGFDKLTRIHNDWIIEMVRSSKDETIQAHRGAYKTTCVSIALAIIIILLPQKRCMFIRKTDNDAKEVIRQVAKILQSPYSIYFVQCIYGVSLKLITNSANEINTNLTADVKGMPQLMGIGLGSSLTGKHFDIIFTDDIVNVADRISKAERDKTKIMYQELQNIKNRDGRIFNSGTPWHIDDAFSLMPNPKKFDCYTTGLINQGEIEDIRSKMTASLFSANYELRYIASDDVIFTTPICGADAALVEQGTCHIDAAYGGDDYTAFTICRKNNGKYYILGKIWRKHIDDVEDEIIKLRKELNAGRIYCEDNGDKGYLAKNLRKKGERVINYHEDMNKFLKITTYLKNVWQAVEFVTGTDTDYINQICDYNENAEHDDAPDSAASIIRKLWNKSDDNNNYVPLWC